MPRHDEVNLSLQGCGEVPAPVLLHGKKKGTATIKLQNRQA